MIQAEILTLARSIKIGTYSRKVIFLQNKNLTDDDVRELFDAIASNPDYQATVEDINLSHNHIHSMPNLFGFHCLKYFSIEDNHLTFIKKFPTLPCLNLLNLANNALTTIPSLSHLHALREIFLQDNPLTDLPRLPNFQNLDYFIADNTKMKFFSQLICEKLMVFVPNLFELPKEKKSNLCITKTLIEELADMLLIELGDKHIADIIHQIIYLHQCPHDDAYLLETLVPMTLLENTFVNVIKKELTQLADCLKGEERSLVSQWLSQEAPNFCDRLAWNAFKKAYQKASEILDTIQVSPKIHPPIMNQYDHSITDIKIDSHRPNIECIETTSTSHKLR